MWRLVCQVMQKKVNLEYENGVYTLDTIKHIERFHITYWRCRHSGLEFKLKGKELRFEKGTSKR